MTNGEKIKEIFPSIPINVSEDTVYCGKSKAYIGEFSKDWWNADYQEPTTKNNLGVDCISRAEVLKLMQDNWHTHNGDWAMQESIDDIRALPSATPQEPRKGHWISMNIGKQSHTKDGMTIESVFCSECGQWLTASDEYACYGRYCSNCGADMREVKE